jgi:hypothetical protein
LRKTHLFIFKISSICIYIGFRAVVQFLKKLPKIPLFGPSSIHQLQLLGSQQHPQNTVLLTSFSTWGIENSLAEINLENMGVIKGCNIWQTLAALCESALLCNKKKSQEQNAAR